MESTSGMRKFVRTPPTTAASPASRGKPRTTAPTSVVVPPTSTTIPSRTPERNAAPRIEFVGPLEKVCTGYMRATSAVMSVPSFCVR